MPRRPHPKRPLASALISDHAAPRLVSLATAVPPHTLRQRDLKTYAEALYRHVPLDDQKFLAVFDHTGVETRHLAMTLEWYGESHTFGESNARYVESALRLAAEVSITALERAGLTPADVDHLVMVSSTGIAAPSLDARLA